MFEACVVVEFWPTGWAWFFRVDAVTAGTVGFMRVQGDHGTGHASREAAELAGRRVALASGWDSPRVVHC